MLTCLLWTLVSAANAKSVFLAAGFGCRTIRRISRAAAQLRRSEHLVRVLDYSVVLRVLAARDWLTAVPRDEFGRWRNRMASFYLPRRLRTLLWC